MYPSRAVDKPSGTFRLGHCRWLDGLRGVAILTVVACHYKLSLAGGFLGVDLFFVISGFLITMLLLEEKAASGTVRLGQFYMRRALRLLPALLLLLSALCVWTAVAHPDQLKWVRKQAVVALCFGANMEGRLHNVPIHHLEFAWSLSVEEQFYLVWPAVLIVLLRFRATKSQILVLVCAGIAAAAVIRATRFYALPPQTDPLWLGKLLRVYVAPETRGDGLLCGCLAAVATWGTRAPGSEACRRLQTAALLSIVFMVVCVCLVGVTQSTCYYGLFTAFALAAATLIVSTLVAPLAPVCEILECRLLVGAGRISYGLFLFHLPIVRMLGFNQEVGWSHPANTVIAITLSVLAATASFYAIERPILRLKNRFRQPRTLQSPLAVESPSDGRQPPRLAA